MYTYSDLNDYIHQCMDKKNHKTIDKNGNDKYYVNLSFVLLAYRILIQIDNNYQLNLRNSEFGDLIGFPENLVNKTKYGTTLPKSQIP